MVSLGYKKPFTYTMVGGMRWSAWSLYQAPPALTDALICVAFSFVATDLIGGSCIVLSLL